MSNREKFIEVLTKHYEELFKNPKYHVAAAKFTPSSLAVTMTAALVAGNGDKDGDGIKLTLKELGIKNTFKAVKEYLNDNH